MIGKVYCAAKPDYFCINQKTSKNNQQKLKSIKIVVYTFLNALSQTNAYLNASLN